MKKYRVNVNGNNYEIAIELIDEAEESGNFINAIDELDNLTKMGINTIHVLPITPVGKIKAFGTAINMLIKGKRCN